MGGVVEREALLRSRCTPRDWQVWLERAQEDEPWSATQAHRRRVEVASRALADFCSGPRGHISVSWGKDSCALLLVALRLGVDWPVVYVRLDPVENPDCATVRDAWCTKYPGLSARYHEVEMRCAPKSSTGRYDTNAAYAAGFAECRRRFGVRRVSGVRAEEASTRALAVAVHGLGDDHDRTGRPIGRWEARDVFAWLRDEPLHPAYPCTMSGAYERGRVRVNNLWGLYGEGHGRWEWERTYYGDAIREIEARHAVEAAAMMGRLGG